MDRQVCVALREKNISRRWYYRRCRTAKVLARERACVRRSWARCALYFILHTDARLVDVRLPSLPFVIAIFNPTAFLEPSKRCLLFSLRHQKVSCTKRSVQIWEYDVVHLLLPGCSPSSEASSLSPSSEASSLSPSSEASSLSPSETPVICPSVD